MVLRAPLKAPDRRPGPLEDDLAQLVPLGEAGVPEVGALDRAEDDVADAVAVDDRLGLAEARELIGRYGVDYVVYGPIERTTYGDAGLDKWQDLGEVVFEQDGTTIWQLS